MQPGLWQTVVRYAYFPFMVIGLNGAGVLRRSQRPLSVWLAPLLGSGLRDIAYRRTRPALP